MKITEKSVNLYYMGMKRLIKLTSVIIGILMAYGTGFAQNEGAKPGGFYQDGYDSHGGPFVSENTDSVTVGAIMNYWAEPDPAIAGTNSTFVWTVAVGTASQTAGTPTNLATVTFGAVPAIGTIKFREVSPAPAGCPGADVTINLAVIALPIVTYPAAGGVSSTCATGTDGSLTIALPALNINWTSSVSGARNLNLQYDVTGPTGFTTVTNSQVNITETGAGTGTFVVSQNLNYYGIYTITLKSAQDRIALKCNDNRNTSGITNATYSYTVLPTPVSGTIYHVPNQ